MRNICYITMVPSGPPVAPRNLLPHRPLNDLMGQVIDLHYGCYPGAGRLTVVSRRALPPYRCHWFAAASQGPLTIFHVCNNKYLYTSHYHWCSTWRSLWRGARTDDMDLPDGSEESWKYIYVNEFSMISRYNVRGVWDDHRLRLLRRQ